MLLFTAHYADVIQQHFFVSFSSRQRTCVMTKNRLTRHLSTVSVVIESPLDKVIRLKDINNVCFNG